MRLLLALCLAIPSASAGQAVRLFAEAEDFTIESGWQVVDCMDLVIHIFSRTAREFYAIEDLWKDSPQVP